MGIGTNFSLIITKTWNKACDIEYFGLSLHTRRYAKLDLLWDYLIETERERSKRLPSIAMTYLHGKSMPNRMTGSREISATMTIMETMIHGSAIIDVD